MKTYEDARALAQSLVSTGTAMGKKVVAVITDMSQPLGNKVGNFFEIEESLDCLEGKGPEDVMSLTYRLGAWMLVASGIADTVAEGERRCAEAVASGKAMELFLKNIRRQGGDVEKMLALRGKFRSPHAQELTAPENGRISFIDAWKIGVAGVYLGVGRNTTEDPVYPDVGFIFEKKAGDMVKKGERIAMVYSKDDESLIPAMELARSSVKIETSLGRQTGKPGSGPASLILEEITAS